jgi:hypothetical protein
VQIPDAQGFWLWLQPPTLRALIPAQGRSLVRFPGGRAIACATGSRRISTRPCGAGDAIGIDVGMTRCALQPRSGYLGMCRKQNCCDPD